MTTLPGADLASITELRGNLAAAQDMATLRLQARRDPESALPAVARQFESLFVKMMLKSMRAASLGDPLFDSPGMDLYRDMHDQEMARQVSASDGVGLARLMVRQLRGIPGPGHGATIARPAGSPRRPESSGPTTPPPATDQVQSRGADFESPEAFVRELLPHARQAAGKLGIPVEVLVAQAALETGWGRHLIRHGDGRSSHNLFGIKADSRWDGARAIVESHEYHAGIPVIRESAFRAYDSVSESFNDYVAFLRADPRYTPALEADGDPEAFVRGLQEAGYATDPAYADKVLNIWQRLTLKVAALGSLQG